MSTNLQMPGNHQVSTNLQMQGNHQVSTNLQMPGNHQVSTNLQMMGDPLMSTNTHMSTNPQISSNLHMLTSPQMSTNLQMPDNTCMLGNNFGQHPGLTPGNRHIESNSSIGLVPSPIGQQPPQWTSNPDYSSNPWWGFNQSEAQNPQATMQPGALGFVPYFPTPPMPLTSSPDQYNETTPIQQTTYQSGNA